MTLLFCERQDPEGNFRIRIKIKVDTVALENNRPVGHSFKQTYKIRGIFGKKMIFRTCQLAARCQSTWRVLMWARAPLKWHYHQMSRISSNLVPCLQIEIIFYLITRSGITSISWYKANIVNVYQLKYFNTIISRWW